MMRLNSGDYPEWELLVQIMSDDEHPELDFDPLDDTKAMARRSVPMVAGRKNDLKQKS